MPVLLPVSIWMLVGCGGDALVEAPGPEPLTMDGAVQAPVDVELGDVYGFDASLTGALAAHATAGPSDLRTIAAPAVKLSFNPMKARYLETILAPKRHGAPTGDGLDEAEQNALRTHGFVVSERLAATSFAQGFLEVYQQDQPVFISADSILHAWHRGFDDTLKQLELGALIPQLGHVLVAMQEAEPAVGDDLRDNPTMSDSLDDADVFLAVARSLLDGTPAVSKRGQVLRIQRLLDAIAEGTRLEVELFGRGRKEDFSHFTPRGHYTESEELKRYFRAAMWLGREDMRVAGPDSSPRELAAALVLEALLERSGQVEALARIDRVMATFVGPTDSMRFADLAALRSVAGAPELGAINDATLSTLRDRMLDPTEILGLAGSPSTGAQVIQSHPYETEPGAVERRELPRSFTFLGQRFTVDGWATSQLVYDRIEVDGALVQRTLPSGVDVAFTAFHADVAADVLADRIESPTGQPGRDGLPIAAQLLAVRDAVDAHAPSLWKQTAYGQWMVALRALSEPPPSPTFSVGRTAAWQRRVMQSQLASWAELRHDTILYVKEPETMGISCAYPAGYVEPNVRFWEALGSAARGMEAMLGSLASEGAGDEVQLLRADQEFFAGFADTVGMLRDIARSQAAQKPLTSAEVQFLRDIMVAHPHEGTGGGCGGTPAWTGYTGWYPKLYQGGATEALDPDALVADVHSSEEANLLVATGAVDRMVVVVDNGPDLMAYAGPISSYYEWAAPERLTDLKWQQRLADRAEPARESWTEGWLVPASSIVRAMMLDTDGDWFQPGGGAERSDVDGGLESLDAALARVTIVGEPQLVNLGLVHARVQTGDEQAIREVVTQRGGRFQGCAEERWKQVPALSGRVSIGWSIDGGVVSNVHVVSNQTGDSTLEKCLVNSVRAMRFAPDTVAQVPEWGLELAR